MEAMRMSRIFYRLPRQRVVLTGVVWMILAGVAGQEPGTDKEEYAVVCRLLKEGNERNAWLKTEMGVPSLIACLLEAAQERPELRDRAMIVLYQRPAR